MFTLSKQQVLLADVNPRKELHGEETVLACDLRLELETANTVLSEFHPTLKSALYAKDADDMLDSDNEAHRPVLRFPQLGALRWDLEMIGCDVTLHYGVSGASDIKLVDAKVNKFAFECKQGGSVCVTFRVQVSGITSAQVGQLSALIAEKVDATLSESLLAKVAADVRDMDKPAPAPNGGWPFHTGWKEVAPKLEAAGFAIPDDDLAKWTGDDVAAAEQYLQALGDLKEGKAPRVPAILKGRVRNGRPLPVSAG